MGIYDFCSLGIQTLQKLLQINPTSNDKMKTLHRLTDRQALLQSKISYKTYMNMGFL